MNNNDRSLEVEPISDYVQSVLARVAEEHNIKVDPLNPTRAQRLAAAMAISSVNNGSEAIAIMVGREIDPSSFEDTAYNNMIMFIIPKSENFLASIAHGYRPTEDQ